MSNEKKILKFKYSIDFVVDTDLPGIVKRPAGHGYTIDCPFCKRINKLNVNVEKNIWACPACNEGGGLLALHAKLHGKNNHWAKMDLDKRFNGLDESEQQAVAPVEVTTKDNNALSLSGRSNVFRHFLSHQPVTDRLLKEMGSDKRGNLTREDIVKLGYREYSEQKINSKFGYVNAAELAVLEAYEDKKIIFNDLHKVPEAVAHVLENENNGIPGFKIRKGHIVAERPVCSGASSDAVYFLPVRARTGEISFFQTMFPKLADNATDEQKARYKKYARYASFGDGGCATSGLESVHYAIKGFDFKSDKTPEEVWLTEGVLKSDIASNISNRPFIALLGITNYSQLPEELKYLKEHGTKRITVAVDMDYIDKDSVANSMNTIIKMVKDSGLECRFATWTHEYKGIDDFLIAVKQGKPNVNLKIETK